MFSLIYRPVIAISIVLGLLVMIELVALDSISWRNQQRINLIYEDIKHGHQLQQLIFELLNEHIQYSSNPSLKKKPPPELHNKIIYFLKNQYPEVQGTHDLLRDIQQLFVSVEQGNQQDLTRALLLSHELLHRLFQEEEHLLDQVYTDSQLEMKLAIFVPIIILITFVLFGRYFIKRQIIIPLNAFKSLITNLIKGEKKPIEQEQIDPAMQPLFNSYNRLVSRLSELEQEHQAHTDSLENEIRNATHTLLEQSHSLARAERLAAVGELAASAAHELRNPLAGIQVALENLHHECDNTDMAERLRLVVSEINRLASRLNQLLAYSKQTPEGAKQIKLFQLVDDLLTLLKYQVKENISFDYDVSENLTVFLPENELRQTLLNLLLNSIQSIGDQRGKVTLHAKQLEQQVEIQICDTGPGFPEAILQQGIRPFVSYKEQGTGLGLSMVQRFAKSHSGMLKINNNSEGHACVKLTLKNSR